MRKITMVGTEKTGKYIAAVTSRAQFGFRDLGDGTFRVRVEPVDSEREALMASFQGWKTGMGGDEFRFSKVVPAAALEATMEHVLKAVGTKGTVSVSPECPNWLILAIQDNKPETEAQEHQRLVAAVKVLKLPGSNLAARWSLASLRAKLA